MRVKIKRFDLSLPLPEYKTAKATSADLNARERVEIKPGEVKLIGLNIAIKIPNGYVGILAARSSTHKLGLMAANGVGIIDPDYCEDEDEWKLAAFNFTKKKVVVEKGTRIAQVLFLPCKRAKWTEVKKMGIRNRGGFGTTGVK